MNALLLTYSTLAFVYFVLRKKYYTTWLQQGNYFFLAIVSFLMLITNGFEYGVAYFAGYLNEMVGFYIEKLGNGFFFQWMALLFLPTIGIINFFRKVRMHVPTQFMLWCLITGILVVNAIWQESLDVFLPFYPQQTSDGSGWHSHVPSALSLIETIVVLGIGIGITALLGKWLKRRATTTFNA